MEFQIRDTFITFLHFLHNSNFYIADCYLGVMHYNIYKHPLIFRCIETSKPSQFSDKLITILDEMLFPSQMRVRLSTVKNPCFHLSQATLVIQIRARVLEVMSLQLAEFESTMLREHPDQTVLIKRVLHN